jgi:hypothetical protein
MTSASHNPYESPQAPGNPVDIQRWRRTVKVLRVATIAGCLVGMVFIFAGMCVAFPPLTTLSIDRAMLLARTLIVIGVSAIALSGAAGVVWITLSILNAKAVAQRLSMEVDAMLDREKGHSET